jgi:hypothetical protein
MIKIVLFLLGLTILSVLIGAMIQFARPWPANWSVADWTSANLLPRTAGSSQAMVTVYCARAGRWRGLLASHCWIVTRARGAADYTRYDVVGWGRPVRHNAFPPDGRWYGNTPTPMAAFTGERAENMVERIELAVARYPYAAAGSYGAWPGPNSNTFVAWIARQVPEMGLELPPTAVGKDYLGSGFGVAPTPSGTGWQVSLAGVLGIGLAYEEGLELNLFGLTLGIDFRDLGIKLPSIGKISLL